MHALEIAPIAVLGGLALLPMVTAAAAEGEKAARPSEFILLAQIALLIAVGRGLGELMQRIGQPSVIGELLGGLLLGPSLFGWLWPSAQAAIFPPSASKRPCSRASRSSAFCCCCC